MKNKKILDFLKQFFLVNLGIVLMAVGIYFFKAQNGFTTVQLPIAARESSRARKKR